MFKDTDELNVERYIDVIIGKVKCIDLYRYEYHRYCIDDNKMCTKCPLHAGRLKTYLLKKHIDGDMQDKK